MSTPTNPPPESPNTYVVRNHSSEELMRLQLQDQMLSAGPGDLSAGVGCRLWARNLAD